MLKSNEYFDGKVKSIGFDNQGEQATVGVMASGSYEFNTAAAERMTVVKGALTIQQQGATEWQTYQAGEAFIVPASSSFKLDVKDATAYLCEFLK